MALTINNYQYPIGEDWTPEEVIDVIAFFQAVEQAYGKGIKRAELLKKYKRFKEIVPGKADEKRYCNEFEKVSGFSSYHTIKKLRESETDQKIKMGSD